MTFLMLTRTIAAAACILSLFACASSTEANEAPASTDQAATEASCGAQYGVANEHYKNAVAGAKQHKIDACGGDVGGDLGYISEEAMKAVSACGAFSNVIKTSQWAAPIREELADTLVLSVLTGDLEVKDGSGKVVFSGLKASLEKGVILWGPAPGAYGNSGNIKFEANGKATVGAQVWPDNADLPHWEYNPATYEIGAVVGDAVRITITSNGNETTYEMRFVMWDDRLPDFEVRAVGAPADQIPAFTAFISQCDA